MPESILTELGGKLFTIQMHDEAQLKQNLPGLPSITPETIHYMGSSTSSSSSYSIIIKTCRLSSDIVVSQKDVESIDKVSIAFSDLADEKSRKQDLPPLLNKINYQLGDKFTVAQNNYEKTKSGIVGIDQSAILLRDVIEQLWGGLVNFVRQKDPRKYKGVELNLNVTGKRIVVDCLATDEIRRQKLTLLFDNLATIKKQLSDSEFGKNPLTHDLDKLTEIYRQWILVLSDIVDFLKLLLYIN